MERTTGLTTSIFFNHFYVDNKGDKYGWHGYGDIECPECGRSVDVGNGDHRMEEEYTCRECGHEFTYSWDFLSE
jgi:DNA-directed RNA polymerase subunit RPC12/RpoP